MSLTLNKLTNQRIRVNVKNNKLKTKKLIKLNRIIP